MSQERVLVAVKERDIRLERDKQDMTEAERELTRLVRRQQSSIPPPPPLPLAGAGLNSLPTGVNNNFTPLDSNLPPLPPFPPDCPTPDYDKESLSSEPSIKNNNTKGSSTASHSVNGSTKNGNADFVEMQSIESFKLTNPSVLRPKPPPIYFQPNMNGSTTTSSASSKVSSDSKPNITIREYPKNTDVKNPERFQFLSQNGSHHTTLSSDEPLVTRLQDELSQTLSKANLRQDSPPFLALSSVVATVFLVVNIPTTASISTLSDNHLLQTKMVCSVVSCFLPQYFHATSSLLLLNRKLRKLS
ncbi:hypothetical protein J6590_008029 [Homalodisca vitripennis]|nr:hypothetical protein J6590_008029 [Homalodisca vitripennis]